MEISRKIAFLYAIVLIARRIEVNGCVWNLNTDIPDKDPIYLRPSTNLLFIPEASGLTVGLNQNVDLVCPGNSNTIIGTGLQEITARCTSSNQLFYSGTSYTLKSLECTSTTVSDLEITNQKCANGLGEIFKIGFKTSRGTVYLIEICYDRVNEASLYAQNILHGKSLIGAEIESNRPSFRVPGLTYGTTTANLYRQADQLTRFTTLLGQTQAQKYINSTSFLARGHLAPDADFLFGSWSFATYFLVNAAPEWQVVNAGNWLKVEDMTRSVASQRQEDLKIYTGTHLVLRLPNASGTLVDMYLMDSGRLRVPKWYWKVIYSEAKQEGIALVTLNNPHAKSLAASERFCKNICQETGWYRQEFNTFSKGFTFCCSVSNLMASVKTLPPLVVIKNMTGPSP